MEKTFVMIKPDGIEKGLVGEVIKQIEDKKLRVVKIKTVKLLKRQVAEIYKESFKQFPQVKKAVLNYMTEKPSIIMIVEGKNAIKKVRKIRGLSDPSKSPPGSIRRDFAGEQKMSELTKRGKATKNIIHSSGSKEEADFEINLFFKEDKK